MANWTSINSLQMSFNQLLYPAVNCKRLFSKTRNSAVFTNIRIWHSSPYKSHTRHNLLKAPILSYESYVHPLKGTLIFLSFDQLFSRISPFHHPQGKFKSKNFHFLYVVDPSQNLNLHSPPVALLYSNVI